MQKSKKPAKTWRSKKWVSALVLSIALMGFATPVAFADSDAGIALLDAAPATVVDAAPNPEPSAEVPVAAVAVSTPEIAPASKTATQTSLDKLSSEILNILIPIFVLLAGALGTAALNWVRKRLKLDVSDKQIGQWSIVAELAAARAGEWARNKTKDLADGKTIPGPDIMEVAANWAIDYGVAHKLPDLGREKLEGLIESKLHTKREAAES